MRYRQPPPPPRGFAEKKRTTRLGQSILVRGTLFDGVNLDPGPLQTLYSLVMADDLDIDDDTPWVLAVECTITDEFVESENQQWVVPLLAEITMGAGGGSHTFQIDAWPYATIQLPAGSVKIIIKWDWNKADGLVKSYPASNIGPAQFVVPQGVEVTGTLVKGFSNSNAKRSFLIQTDADAPLDTGLVPIPDFATQCFYWAESYAGMTGTLGFYEASQTTGFALSEYTIAELIALRAIGEQAPIPANAGFWRLEITAPDPTPLAPSRVSFPIRL